MREDIDRKFLTLKHATEELNLDIKEQLKVHINKKKWQAVRIFFVNKVFSNFLHDDEIINVYVTMCLQNEKVKTKETVAKLDESISIVEKQAAENKKQFEKVMGAEISQRYKLCHFAQNVWENQQIHCMCMILCNFL